MTALESINQFVDTMLACEHSFEEIRLEIGKRNSQLANCVKQFKSSAERLMSDKIETEDEALQKLYDDIHKTLAELLRAIQKDIERQQKGAKFIKDHEQSFNVAVFGKVKAGKSYLGNFIMGSQIRKLGLETAYSKLPSPPVVEVYDRGKQSKQDHLSEIPQTEDGFFVDPNEATSTIQLFHLGGLTWFDTPGIGSVTWENEMLAKDYVENADLVVYTSNSDAAGTRQDFTEMKDLYQKGKRFLLLLTQSDTVEEGTDDDDEIIGVLTAKSEKDRRDTEAYMIETLKEKCLFGLKENEILTISAKLAVNALEEGSEEMFRDSNMGAFLNVLTNITKSEAAQLKLQTPINRVNSAAASILKRLDEAEEKIKTCRKEMEETQEKMDSLSAELLEVMKQQCRSRVETVIRRKSQEVEEQKKSVGKEELSQLISKEIFDVMCHTCMGEFAANIQMLSDYEERLRVDAGDLKMKTDEVKYKITVVRRVERDPEGIGEWIGSKVFHKTYRRPVAEEEERSSSVDIGVNEQQIMAIAHGELDRLFADEVPQMMKKLAGGYLTEIAGLIDGAEKCVQEARKELEALK